MLQVRPFVFYSGIYSVDAVGVPGHQTTWHLSLQVWTDGLTCFQPTTRLITVAWRWRVGQNHEMNNSCDGRWRQSLIPPSSAVHLLSSPAHLFEISCCELIFVIYHITEVGLLDIYNADTLLIWRIYAYSRACFYSVVAITFCGEIKLCIFWITRLLLWFSAQQCQQPLLLIQSCKKAEFT